MQRSSLLIVALACALPMADAPAAARPVPAHASQAAEQLAGRPPSDPSTAVLAVRADMEGAKEAVQAIRGI
jgi:hypothetical protein